MNNIIYRVGQLFIKDKIPIYKSTYRYLNTSLINNKQFKSAYSLENLYPKSNLKLCTPLFTPENADAKFSGFIPMNELTVTYSRSSGPGGQNVNTTSSKVDLRFQVKNANWLSDEIKEKLLIQEKHRINKEGFLIIRSELTRLQNLNLADALNKLRTMIRNCTIEKPKISPETEERLRKQQIKAARVRLFEKRHRSMIKSGRNSNNIDL